MKTTYQFTNCNATKTVPRETFMEAWNDMYKWVKQLLDSGGMSYQVLETAIWIDVTIDGLLSVPIFFYDARDTAIDKFGWSAPK